MKSLLTLLKNKNNNSISKSSAKLYVNNLKRINGDNFDNLDFLKNSNKVIEYLDKLKVNTRRTYLYAVINVVKNVMQDIKLLEVYQKYADELDVLLRENESKEKDNIKDKSVEYEYILNIKNKYFKKINKRDRKQNSFKDVLYYFLISLYTDIPPRRSQDYVKMKIVKEYDDKMDDKFNYLDLKNKEFIFNEYKTSKTYGKQTISFSNNKQFLSSLKLYLRQREIYKLKKNDEPWFLIGSHKKHISSQVALYKIFRTIFDDKKISTSMLRHLYITEHLSDMHEKQQNIATKMGQSVSQQKDYIIEE